MFPSCPQTSVTFFYPPSFCLTFSGLRAGVDSRSVQTLNPSLESFRGWILSCQSPIRIQAKQVGRLVLERGWDMPFQKEINVGILHPDSLASPGQSLYRCKPLTR